MDESMQIDTNRYVDKERIWGQPIGLSDELAKQAIENLKNQARQITKDMSRNDEEMDLEIGR